MKTQFSKTQLEFISRALEHSCSIYEVFCEHGNDDPDYSKKSVKKRRLKTEEIKRMLDDQ